MTAGAAAAAEAQGSGRVYCATVRAAPPSRTLPPLLLLLITGNLRAAPGLIRQPGP